MPTTDLAVIGAGPAGLAAAITAARAGAQVTLIDEYPRPGGQYLKGATYPNGSPPVSATERQARALLPELAHLERQDPETELIQSLVVRGPSTLRLVPTRANAA